MINDKERKKERKSCAYSFVMEIMRIEACQVLAKYLERENIASRRFGRSQRVVKTYKKTELAEAKTELAVWSSE
jgi:hypothetical protein